MSSQSKTVRNLRNRGLTWEQVGREIGKSATTARRWAEDDIGRASVPNSFFYLSDVHIPQQHNGLLLHAINLIEQLKPNTVVVAGDWYDSECVSSHPKNPHLMGDLLDDLGKAQPFEQAIANACQEIVFLEGNHEDRLRRYLMAHAPAVQRLLPPSQVFFPGAHKYVDYPRVFQATPYLSFVHGRFARSSPLGSVKAHYAELGTSVVMGHQHKHASQILSVNGRQLLLMENGHCQDESQVKFMHPPWVQSAGVYIEASQDGSHLFALDFPCLNGRVRGNRI